MDLKEKPLFTLIENRQDLDSLAASMEKDKIVAVDMEADSLHHFTEKVCLLQIAFSGGSFIVDTLRLRNLSPLKPIFANPGVKKIFHGADFDVRSLHRDFGIEINNLFDTQIACRFLGYDGTGLDKVIYKTFDVVLEKKHRKKDWSMRPLPLEMIEYAARDTLYLTPLAEKLEKELKKKRRFKWVMEECLALTGVRHKDTGGDPLFLKIKGARRLNSRELAVLEELLKLRVTIARKKDRPLFKVFMNDSLLKIALGKPKSLAHLGTLGALSPRQIRYHGESIMAAVKRGLALPKNRLPVFPVKKSPRLSPGVSEKIALIKGWRNQKAERLSLDPTLIFTKSAMTAIARRNPVSFKDMESVPELRSWQIKAFGNELIRFLNKNR